MATTKNRPVMALARAGLSTLAERSTAFRLAFVIGLGTLFACSVAPVSATNDAEAALILIIHSVERGWEQADSEPFREHFLDFGGARYIESGGQNNGLSDLIEHHVVPEGDALKNFDLTFSNIEIHLEGDFAWAIADVEVVATLTRDGRKIHNRGYETFLFRRLGRDWKVVHTHSSSRPVKDENHAH